MRLLVVASALFVAGLGFVGMAAAQSCPPENCSNPPQYGCAAPGTCMERPWGAIICMSGPNGGYWLGWMNRTCARQSSVTRPSAGAFEQALERAAVAEAAKTTTAARQ